MRLSALLIAFAAFITLLLIHEGGITMAEHHKILNEQIPPIDKNIPAQIETATFALG